MSLHAVCRCVAHPVGQGCGCYLGPGHFAPALVPPSWCTRALLHISLLHQFRGCPSTRTVVLWLLVACGNSVGNIRGVDSMLLNQQVLSMAVESTGFCCNLV
jgi:hypothetical protein